MSTLDELVLYCGEKRTLGALMLTGEWGCGKTYLIDHELTEELKKTHFVVRISLMGLNSLDAVNTALRNQWFAVCTPLLGRLKKQEDRAKQNSGALKPLINILKSLNPFAGNAADVIISGDLIDHVPIESTADDLHNQGTKKKVVLVFDDLDRSKLDKTELMGFINDYCENKKFKTIVVINEKYVKAREAREEQKEEYALYKQLKEKTIVRTVLCVPDFRKTIDNVIDEADNSNPEYIEFLAGQKDLIYEVFAEDPVLPDDTIAKNHNVRSLITALQEFRRIYEILVQYDIPDPEDYLYSFIAYMMIVKSGISKNELPCYDVSEDEIRQLYPQYSHGLIPRSIRSWIEYGYWDEESIKKDLSAFRSDPS